MKIEFDATKDDRNVAKHGISLARAVDFEAVAIMTDDRFAYGEERLRAFGHIDGVAHCLVYTVRNTVVRVISLRRAHVKEMKRYAP